MFHPKNVAIIGASPNGSGLGFISSYQEVGFKGPIYPVNPRVSEVMGYKAYPTIASIPEKVDFVIVSVPARLVPQILNECADAGANNIHVFTAGFREVDGDEGVALERQIKEIAEERELAIVGPNGMGLYVPEAGISGWRRAPKESGPVGLVCQSGTVSQLVTSSAIGAGFRISKAISFGNGTVLDSTDFLEYFKDDPKTEIIAMYLEGIGDGRKLTQIVGEINPRKPVIILKGGLTESGAKAVASHTGSLAGSEAVWNAFFKQTGAVRVDTPEELVDLIMTFSHLQPMRGRRLAVLCAGGGRAVAMADALAREGLETPNLAEEIQRELRPMVPEAGTSIKNPLDAGWIIRQQANLDKALDLIGGDPKIDAFLMDFAMRILGGMRSDTGRDNGADPDLAKLGEFARDNVYRKPLAAVLGTMGYDEEAEIEKLKLQKSLVEAGIAVFPSVSRAARALSKFADHYDYLRQLE